MNESILFYDVADSQLLDILDSLMVGVVIIEPVTHTIVYTNPEAIRMIERPASELLGHICHEYICPAAIGSCPITDLKQDVDESQRCVVNRSGDQVPILKTVKRLHLNEKEYYIEIFMDVSDIREKERLQGTLEMAGAAAHHFSQPMQVLITGMELLRKRPSSEKTDIIIDTMWESMMVIKDLIGKIQRITHYKTQEYVNGKRIIDIHHSSVKKES